MFDPTKPHEHRCDDCGRTVPCSAKDCEYPQFTQCGECQAGFKLVDHEGTPTYIQRRPYRPGNLDSIFADDVWD